MPSDWNYVKPVYAYNTIFKNEYICTNTPITLLFTSTFHRQKITSLIFASLCLAIFFLQFHSPAKIPNASPCEPSFESHRSQWMPWRPDAPTVLLESKDLSYNQKNWNKTGVLGGQTCSFFRGTKQLTNQKMRELKLSPTPLQKKMKIFDMEVWTWYCYLTVGIHSIWEIFEDFLGVYGQFLGCSIFWDGMMGSLKVCSQEPKTSLEPQDWESRWLSRPANQKWTHLYSGNCYRLSSYEVWTSQHFLADAVEHIASAIDF